MKITSRYRPIIINALIAVGISLIVNFSDFLISRRPATDPFGASARQAELTDSLLKADSVYQYANDLATDRRDAVRAVADSLNAAGARIAERGTTIGKTSAVNQHQPNDQTSYRERRMKRDTMQRSALYQGTQMVYFFILAFILLSIATARANDQSGGRSFVRKLILCLLISVALYFLTPRVGWEGELTVSLFARNIVSSTSILKCSLTLVVAILYGKIYELLYQRQRIVIENEILRNENLEATYNTLVNQMNPHFFFNSLNSLSMLVREKQNHAAVIYIDRLSDTFRYIMQNSRTGYTTLEEELNFVESYKYLLETRYEGKLFIDISIDPKYYIWRLPSFTLQPLIENAVKHNSITKAAPLRIFIRSGEDNVTVSNPINPKIGGEGTGIGLKNLGERYRLLTGRDITIGSDNGFFTVTLPLTPPEK